MTDEQAIETARCKYATDDLEIDDAPALSHAENGTWVAAWVWVPNPDVDEWEE